MKNLLFLLSSIRWQDVIDIILNSYILFRFYVIFRGTNAFRVLIGLVLLWFSQRIAVSVGLIVTSWAIQAITAVAAIIIIVVFRNEIGSVLQAKTLKTLLWEFARKTPDTPVEVLLESVYELSRTHTGALIVLPARDSLEEVVHAGIPWNGQVSKEMLLSIFWPDNPVHDGAVILQGSRVREVGAILPLSRDKGLPSYYGTRHRAGLGLSENTDAMVIIVSEERGNVTVARNGHLVEIQRMEELADALHSHLGRVESMTRQSRREKRELGIAALLSVLFVIGIWFSFSRGQASLVTLEIPIQYLNRSPEMEILSTSADKVRLNLTGADTLIRNIRPEQVAVRINLANGQIGRNSFAIAQNDIRLPPGIVIERVEPATVTVVLDAMVQKELPVQIDWVGSLPANLIMVSATVTPATVRVYGGSLMVKDIGTLYTEPLPLDDIRESGSLTANLVLYPPSLRLAPDSRERVKITYVVTRKTPQAAP
jgi:uncharacterized protein (TIGR00159 family)